MGAGKSTVGEEVARLIGRPFHDLDREIEAALQTSIASYFAEEGEEAFRKREAAATIHALRHPVLAVLALGGGAVTGTAVRDELKHRAVTVLLDIDAQTAWERSRGSDRPLAGEQGAFVALYDQRRPLYVAAADATAANVDDAVLSAGGIHVEMGALERLGELVPGSGPVALVSDPQVGGIHGADAQLALGSRLSSTLEVTGKSMDDLAGLWAQLGLDREGTVVALGGGTTTDVAGFAAATYMRGVAWVSVPTSLVGQVDAGIGGKTGVDLPTAKNLAGAFHWPQRTIVDPALLQTLPAHERRMGMAEVVKTGLLAGEPLWELSDPELVRRCAAFKTAICLRDPHDRGERKMLNLGHTFAHALEAGSNYRVPHGQAVALGLLAALRLSGLDTADVERILSPEPVEIDRERAWSALRRDKKSAGGRLRLVLLERAGVPLVDQDVPEEVVRAELEKLTA